MSTEETLAKVELFRDIEQNDLEMLAKIVVSRQFKSGETIVKEGEPGVAFYIIAKGKAEVVKGAGQVVATFGPEDFFGEMALFDDSPRSASVRAVEDTECLVMSKWDLKTVFMATDARVAFALLAVLARRVRNLTDAVTH
jgi:CRP-like cAMP-binding protein